MQSGMCIQIRQLPYHENSEILAQIRQTVFVQEQGVPVDLEMDGRELESTHFLAFIKSRNDNPETVLGSARLLPTGQIGRMAVLAEFRGRGIGYKLLQHATNYGFSHGFPHLFLHAQRHAQHFYEKAGYVARGDVFLEAGIEHIEMFKSKT